MSRKAAIPRAGPARKSTIGRPRILTDEQVVAIMAWHDARSVWRAQRAAVKTLRQFAKEMGVTHGTITYVIRRRGELKQASPDKRDKEAQVRRGLT